MFETKYSGLVTRIDFTSKNEFSPSLSILPTRFIAPDNNLTVVVTAVFHCNSYSFSSNDGHHSHQRRFWKRATNGLHLLDVSCTEVEDTLLAGSSSETVSSTNECCDEVF